MDIPTPVRWLMVALAAVQLAYALRALRPALRAAPGERTDPWLALADHALGIPVALALAAGHLTVFLYATAALGPVLTWQLLRHLRPAPGRRDGRVRRTG
ncbi:hypothetical protein [Streptomyces sp. NPDC047014]|uniref:hypothetical protein n=1 Tax=Streptomyces sp. NPDC047014 TaxID=3155736 RepID=UPI0033EEDDC9